MIYGPHHNTCVAWVPEHERDIYGPRCTCAGRTDFHILLKKEKQLRQELDDIFFQHKKARAKYCMTVPQPPYLVGAHTLYETV